MIDAHKKLAWPRALLLALVALAAVAARKADESAGPDAFDPKRPPAAELGFDLLSRANDHAPDWGVGGMRETGHWLDAAGLTHAGGGANRGLARAPQYFESAKGRIALVALHAHEAAFDEESPGDFLRALTHRASDAGADGFADERTFQSVIAVSRFEAGRVAEIRLHPVDLGYGRRLPDSGVPRLASRARGRPILERMREISKPYGTRIAVGKNVARIRPQSP